MQRDLAALVHVLLVAIVAARVLMMKRAGTNAIQFGKIDWKDFIIPPFALVYYYAIFAHALGWPAFNRQVFFQSDALSWLGVLLCAGGLTILTISVISFGSSFRVGIDTSRPGELVTTGIFAASRNPIYFGLWTVLFGQFLVFPNWLLLVYLLAASWLFHRQVLREEAALAQLYGREYANYCSRVRRYV